MSEGNCEIAASWSDQRNYSGPIKVWRPRSAAPAPILPADGPRTLEEMVAAHKARQVRLAASGARERDRLRAIVEEARQAQERNEKALAEKMAALRAKWAKDNEERIIALRAKYTRNQMPAATTYPSIRKIITALAQAYNVPPIDLISMRRTANVVLPRQIAMYLAKVTTLRSLPDIGRQFGGKDHTTIIHAVRKIAARMAVDDAFRAKVEALRAAIEAAE
jgi:chromosomal replication initiation ATPase DnaA